jgi:GntR family transcriptional regulator
MTDRRPSIQFRLDARSGVAPYRQLVDQVGQAVNSGLLQDGDQLPSVRDVVTQITINPNTVHRAYRELEHQGIAQGRSGLGTFITSRARSLVGATNIESVQEDLGEWVRKARSVGLDDEKIADLVMAALRQVGEVFS